MTAVGDTVRFEPIFPDAFAAPRGTLARVTETNVRMDLGTGVRVEWLDRSHGQEDGVYYVDSFEAVTR